MDELAKKMICETLNAEMKADVDSEFTQSTKSQTGYTYHELLLFLHNTRRDYLDDYVAQKEIDAKLNMQMPPHKTVKEWLGVGLLIRRLRVPVPQGVLSGYVCQGSGA